MNWLRNSDPLSWLLPLIGAIYAAALFNHPLIPSMEPRFAEAVREMIARGEYLVPIKNGLPYIEYPPLYFWLSILGAVLGLPLEVAIRLPGYLGLLLWVAWLARLQRELFPTWPRWLLPLTGAALPAVLYNFYTAQSDSLLILGTLIAFTGFIRMRTDPPLRRFPWEMWLGVALATAAKGPVGIAVTLPVMALEVTASAFLSLQADTGEPRGFSYRVGRLFREIWRLAPLRGLLVASLGIVPWYLAAGYAVNWDFVRAVLVYQNFTRFFIGFDHLQPWWLYAQTVWFDLVPLSLLLPFGLFYGVRYARREFRWRLLVIWVGWTLLFFTVSASKQSKYILPAAPAMAALGLAAIEPVFKTDNLHRLVRRLLGGVALVMLALFATLVLSISQLTFVPRIQHLYGMQNGYAAIKSAMDKAPGALVSFQWPRSLTLYYLGAPMSFVRSSRELYQKIHDGVIKPGDYILVNDYSIPQDDEQDPTMFRPAPLKAEFEVVLHAQAEEPMTLYRVKPGAADLPLPKTPEPPPLQWWNQFDTD